MLENFEKYLYQTVFPLQPPESIFHYTTQKGILGIVAKREMWATQVHFLNDKNEVLLTFKLLERELKKQADRAQNPAFKKLLNSIRRNLSHIDQGHICIASFCEAGDLLSQWRGYGNQGKGYAIGFNLKELTRIAKRQHFVLWPCVYSSSLQIELVSYLIDSWCREFCTEKFIQHDKMFSVINTSVCQLAPIIKDESFSEEKEWRLVSSVVSSKSPCFAFREGEYSLIPYYNFQIADENGRHSIKKIIVGPSPHIELACNSLATFLTATKLPTVEIISSKIPFRNWK
ncbi:MAG: DUF2971 domain-containing protein [Erysipelotrichia bacterium]|nr:DUF2971 domain-containing protein [Erysipelotrichia bacterium]